MRTTPPITRTISVPIERVLEAMEEPHELAFAPPVRSDRTDGEVRWLTDENYFPHVVRIARAEEAAGGKTALTLHAEYRVPIPYFRWAVTPLVRSGVKDSLLRMAEVIEARATGKTPPSGDRRRILSIPGRLTVAQASLISTVSMILAVTGYGGTLFTQALHLIRQTYGASEADLGVALAITRAGTLIGLAGSIFADRRGRRRILLLSTAGVCLSTLLSALAPSLAVFTGFQVISRGFLNLAAVVGLISITEEAAEGSRAFTLAIASIAGAAGFALGVLLLPLARLAPQAWRGLFVLGGLGILLVPGIALRLTETQRFQAMGERVRMARAREIVDPLYGRRFLIVAAAGFLLNFNAAPTSQFMNLYLVEERGFTEFGILILRFFTQGVPALAAVWMGGRLADSRGRVPVAASATLVAAITTASFFLFGGPALWASLLLSTAAGALAGPSLAAFNYELFPTEVRGRAGGWLLIVAVGGSIAGLLASGHLAEPAGSVGQAIAITAIAPFIVAVVLIPKLPEGRGMDLDKISPPRI